MVSQCRQSNYQYPSLQANCFKYSAVFNLLKTSFCWVGWLKMPGQGLASVEPTALISYLLSHIYRLEFYLF